MRAKHVLLIDDNEIDNYINNHIISKSKIAERITVKRSAVEALEYLEAIENSIDDFPDLILLDIAMPIMDGFGFLDKIITFPKIIEKRCFVIMLTSSNNQNDRDRALQYEIVKDYFVKPLKKEMLEGIF
ncbi:MAG: response regulator [Flavobacterium sp.]